MIKKIFYKFNSLKISNKKIIFLILLLFINISKPALLNNILNRTALIGGIGSGKTTILNNLSRYCKEKSIPINIIYEPIDEITESNQLENFCKDMESNAYYFQSSVMDKMNDKLIKEQNFKYNNIIESSIIANQSFVRILNKDGYISNDQENELSKKRIEYLKKNPISNIIYLTSRSAKQELERIKKRGRFGEIYTIEYLKNLNNAHRETIQKYKSFGMSVLEIKNDSDELNQKNLNEMCEEICNFLMQ